MMKKAHNLIVLMLLACGPIVQAQQEVEMADTMRSEGKIYVVVAIVLVILAGLFTYLFLMDRQVTRLEKRLNDRKD